MSAARTHHATYLGMAVAVVVLSFVLQDSGAVTFLGYPLPPLCPFKSLSGHDCPGCGLTRSFVAIAHGRFEDAFAFHRLGFALFLAASYQLWYRPWMIRRDEVEPPPSLARVHRWIGRALIAALVVSWLVNTVVGSR